ncbi:tryptophan--tRNA ligase [Candidatus Nomurabacteria bacterium RIFCSPHIGHO2_02_FULL_37_45]|uniref:Tryptophan--tRNA ligase n=2 Tax=Candidatus Nomuraibacteriota TaxID=1752729 RepID=A0A1F6Y313_9BACT|nr:MAG: tryptophan--tRNA ligase [Candidatus Nomurabacteria bacterium RIFCSPHIGHO2_01_FULL_37_110]OGI71315.1 MAG: tryptophan--tRNA ligase [Candidatus Nomurabacteria bacterium RIFCSPHIGHO2_02_FULL_37_45]OGI79543.1 MAG: tryptophan--tRNA ligase [Candidatus Nomurabacteria bacterium RIFCSPHIGHO2_12_FULL_37_29]OGI85426.1 MAG: tryptophan--tRNA ligase [Candidatus Nomurabacteria bacterium RIFCSPLOWO2_01_FULL_37_49]OGJ00732.1 MAG: tryptophan--tRNA ligase [Candidatus Nomurabacteria bacterium RIFCSPLOWO2_12
MGNIEKIVLTGDRPTGRLHLGHYVGSIKNRIKLQNEVSKAFYMVADVQALTDNADNPQKIRNNVVEVVLDNLACGVDPKKTTFFIQSQVPEIAELTVFFMNLVTFQQLSHNPTIKTELKEKGFVESTPFGFLAYPVSQAADILFCKANTVPVGIDQMPVLEQANEIIKKFNATYGVDLFSKITGVVSNISRLVGIDGNSKMSKSLGNCIYLSDSDKEIEEKVMQAYTDPHHIHVEDKGKVEGNVVFTYLDVFDEDKKSVAELKAQYQKGGLGDVVLKKRLTKILVDLITPIRTKREEIAKDPELVMNILKKGTEIARKEAKKTMIEVRKALKIDYFD